MKVPDTQPRVGIIATKTNMALILLHELRARGYDLSMTLPLEEPISTADKLAAAHPGKVSVNAV